MAVQTSDTQAATSASSGLTRAENDAPAPEVENVDQHGSRADDDNGMKMCQSIGMTALDEGHGVHTQSEHAMCLGIVSAGNVEEEGVNLAVGHGTMEANHDPEGDLVQTLH